MLQRKKEIMTPWRRPVLVTTQEKGVFFGYAEDTTGETIFLQQAQLCIYWSADLRGFMGLAAMGPSGSCKIGPPADITIRHVTSVVEVGPGAEKKWLALR